MTGRDSLRRGYLMIAVLAVLFAVSGILLSMLPHLLRVRREGRFDHAMMQAEMLARAGVLRAREQWNSNPSYTGEDWVVPISPETKDRGRIVIRMIDGLPGERELAIVARFLPGGVEQSPNAFVHTVQYELKLPFKITTSETIQGDKP